ncbi:DMT family transporter [Paraglaciecola polaris]|uniref:DMT family transporter n=1 Tax=Paraglaciecola polaris TaxID=222814 RepID=UPI0030EEBB63|tara:strand:- start:3302 stop:4204 length:903 start_codon:yes stop_codon:yes gene_type:complete
MAIIRSANTEYQFGVGAILFSSLLWGTTGTAATFAPNVSPAAMGAFAMGGGGLILAVSAYRQVRHHYLKILLLKRLWLFSALALAIYPLAFYTAMGLAGVAVGTVVSIASAPFFAAVLECLISKEVNITKRWFVSFALGLVGIALLAFSESSTGENNTDKMMGIALGLLAGLTYAIYAWGAKTMIDKGVQSQAAMGSIFGLGAMVLLPSLLFSGDNLFASSTNTIVVFYMAVIPMALGYFAFGYGLRHIKASSASLLTLLEPVVAAILAVLVVGEVISPVGWFGITLILLCLWGQTSLKS